jgi:hypothetical protein
VIEYDYDINLSETEKKLKSVVSSREELCPFKAKIWV